MFSLNSTLARHCVVSYIFYIFVRTLSVGCVLGGTCLFDSPVLCSITKNILDDGSFKDEATSSDPGPLDKEKWNGGVPQRRAAYCLLEADRSYVHDRSALAHQDNRLLAALPVEMFALMGHDLKQIPLAHGQALYEPGQPIDQIYFPQSGMISLLVVAKDGGAIETATIGREGAVGLHGALGKRLSFTRATIQVSGKFSVIRAATFGQLVLDHAPVRDLIARYTEVLWAEAQQIAACNAVHETSARLCRWLLQTADRIGSDHLPLTQELIAQMLGVRRTTVTLMAKSLERHGAIRYARGHIQILDRKHLEHCACECYAVMQQEKLPLKIGVQL